MSDQEFRDRILSAIEELKRTHERSIDDVKETIAESERTTEHAIAESKRTTETSIAEVKESIAESERTTKRSLEEIQHDIKHINNKLQNVEQNVAWIKGRSEGRQELITNKNSKSAIWIALGSALAAIISLIKSFW